MAYTVVAYTVVVTTPYGDTIDMGAIGGDTLDGVAQQVEWASEQDEAGCHTSTWQVFGDGDMIGEYEYGAWTWVAKEE